MQNPRTFFMSLLTLVFMIVIMILSILSSSKIDFVVNKVGSPLGDEDKATLGQSKQFAVWVALLAGGGAILSLFIMWYAWEGSATGMATRAGSVARTAKAGWSGAISSMKSAE